MSALRLRALHKVHITPHHTGFLPSSLPTLSLPLSLSLINDGQALLSSSGAPACLPAKGSISEGIWFHGRYTNLSATSSPPTHHSHNLYPKVRVQRWERGRGDFWIPFPRTHTDLVELVSGGVGGCYQLQPGCVLCAFWEGFWIVCVGRVCLGHSVE